MKTKFQWIAGLAIFVLLVGCTPAPTGVPTQPQQENQVPTQTAIPIPTNTLIPIEPPKRESIVFSSNRGDDPNQLGLYLIDPETLQITPIDTGMEALLARWSPDGETIVFAVPDIWNLYTVHPDGTGLTQVTDFRSNNADWSPDGNRLVFQSDHDNEPENTPDIYIIDITGENLVEIQDVPPIIDYSPRWSPDGSLILFISALPGSLQVFTMQPDGTQLKQITGGAENVTVGNWSPDGSRIVYVSGKGNTTELYIVDADGQSNLVQLTDDDFTDDGPVFSPDGKRIVFFSNRGGNWDLWMIDVDGTNLVQLTNDAYYDAYPDWRP